MTDFGRLKCPSAPRVVICIKRSPFAPTGTMVTSATQHHCGIMGLREESCLKSPSLSKLTLWAISQVGLWCHMWTTEIFAHLTALFVGHCKNNINRSLKYGSMSSWQILSLKFKSLKFTNKLDAAFLCVSALYRLCCRLRLHLARYSVTISDLYLSVLPGTNLFVLIQPVVIMHIWEFLALISGGIKMLWGSVQE